MKSLQKLNFTDPSWFSFHIIVSFGGTTKKESGSIGLNTNLLGDVYADIGLNVIFSWGKKIAGKYIKSYKTKWCSYINLYYN